MTLFDSNKKSKKKNNNNNNNNKTWFVTAEQILEKCFRSYTLLAFFVCWYFSIGSHYIVSSKVVNHYQTMVAHLQHSKCKCQVT